MASAIWSDTRMTGSSAFVAPWKTIDTVRQRRSRMPRSVRRWMCMIPREERRSISPVVRSQAARQQAHQRERAVVVLPQPDSPARPSASPRRSWNETSSTMRTTLRRS